MFKKWKKKLSLFRKQLLIFMAFSKKISFSTSSEKRKIVICFDGLFSHGGLVDRLKGIISFYEIAKMLDYDFFIYFDHPFKLAHFLAPNKVNWEIKKKELKFNLGSSKVFYLMDNFNIDPLELIRKSNAKTIFVYNNIDYLPTIHKTNTIAENSTIWRTNFNALFKVSDSLNTIIYKLPNEDRIVVHTRFTTLMGDFKDTTSKVLSERNKYELIGRLIVKIEEIANLNPTKKVYVLSDSIFFLNYIKENTGFLVLDGTPKHIDMNTTSNDLLLEYKTFSDFYFMVNSSEIFLIKLEDMYNSAFSRYAAILGNKKFTLIE